MHNIVYKNGEIESELCSIVNVHKPFHSKVDKFKRKASISKLILTPDETLNSNQIKRYLVTLSPSTRFAYKLHVTYRNDLKCHNIYETNTSVDKVLRGNVISKIIEDVDNFTNLKSDLLNIIRVVVKSYTFDGIITDIPWLINNYQIPVTVPDWKLIDSIGTGIYQKSIDLLLNEYGEVPMNILPYECLENLPVSSTDIVFPDYKCPLIVMKSNSFYAGYLAKKHNAGLPLTLFKVVGRSN